MFKLQYCTKFGQLILRKIIKIVANAPNSISTGPRWGSSQKSPSGVQGCSPSGHLGAKPPEAEKHDKFCAYNHTRGRILPLYLSYIITFVIGFSRNMALVT